MVERFRRTIRMTLHRAWDFSRDLFVAIENGCPVAGTESLCQHRSRCWNGNYENIMALPAAHPTSINLPGGNSLLTAFQLGWFRRPIQPRGSKLGPNLFATSGVYSLKEAVSKAPMSQQWNFSVQQQLAGGFLFEAYSANHGTHLLSGNYDSELC